MEIPYSRWHQAIRERRSRRHFDPDLPIATEVLADLDALCHQFVPFTGARAVLVTHSAESVFKGFIGGYGKITGAPAFIAFAGNVEDPSVQEKVGYTGEGIILEATALGLSTCWLGLFKEEAVASVVKLHRGEQVMAITPVGYAMKAQHWQERLMTGFVRSLNRLPLTELVRGLPEEQWPGWVGASLEAARLAPSAVNHQPWSFEVQEDGVTVSVRTRGPEFRVSKRLDCGIAMLHLEVAAADYGYKGEWEFLRSPQVARFRVSSRDSSAGDY
jgi:nitroreductase